jgi:hypothetical protein
LWQEHFSRFHLLACEHSFNYPNIVTALKVANMRVLFVFLVSILLASKSVLAVSWTLTSTTLDQSSFAVQPYVANGYIGQRLPVEGFGYREIPAINAAVMDGTSGWPLFDTRFTAAMVAGFYDQQDTTIGTNFVRDLRSQGVQSEHASLTD